MLGFVVINFLYKLSFPGYIIWGHVAGFVTFRRLGRILNQFPDHTASGHFGYALPQNLKRSKAYYHFLQVSTIVRVIHTHANPCISVVIVKLAPR